MCSIRDGLDPMQLSAYELLLKLEDVGFQWRQWPSKPKDRQQIAPYKPGEGMYWYSTHAAPPKSYFLALLRAEARVR